MPTKCISNTLDQKDLKHCYHSLPLLCELILAPLLAIILDLMQPLCTADSISSCKWQL